MVDPRAEEALDILYEEQQAWVREAPLVAARKAKGRHPNPQDDDPCMARLRQDFLLVEKALPYTAFGEGWDPAAWKDSVRASCSPTEFRDCLANLESSVQDNHLSPHYLKVPLLVKGAWLPTGISMAFHQRCNFIWHRQPCPSCYLKD